VTVRLDILSDPVCPWCFIGKANLDRALEAAPDHPFSVEWHPFMLNPDMPAEGADRQDYLAAKFGGRAALQRAEEHLKGAAAAAGISLDPDTVRRIPNTLDAHRLIHWAGLEGRQTPVVGALFRAHFLQGRDIGDPATLAAIAGEQGLDAAMIARLLSGDADRVEIRARDAHARSRGVQAVPTFIVANRHAVQGAQPADLWARVIADLATQPGS
jgi:predicted DsbA family dithiol-disulfide isomerase